MIGVVLNKTSRRVGAGYSYRYGYSTTAKRVGPGATKQHRTIS